MRAFAANLLALLFLCTCASVLYIWTGLEDGTGRYRRGARTHGAASAPAGSPPDRSLKTFRALLAVPPVLGILNHSIVEERTDTSGKRKSNLDLNKGTAIATPLNPKLEELVEDGVFWSERLEALLPQAFSGEHARTWIETARVSEVVSLEPGCGRTSNRLATFSDGSRACVRYGINEDQVQGETLSYYLASLLGMTSLPPITLSQLSPDSPQWAAVTESIGDLQWSWKAVVSLTEWVSNLTGVVTPAPLRHDGKGLHPVREQLANKTLGELLELVQWTDLIVFDYLTANFDRLVSNLFSLQWDPRVMERDTSNLQRTPGGALVLIDNEAGLVHGYRVLQMWERYHDELLGSVCLFRKRTAHRVLQLHRLRDAAVRLRELYRLREPLAPELGFLSEEHATILQTRMDRLHRHILHCKERYSRL
ncbi:four-jointed box protein 1 [Brienomyrus brachyistius]|uniref:four-jointed box protein 1 n=1 Tax=Brienomyrus brachyistius TaxID=42636 RepID=UPI0020B28A7A|nr:four-jointed box protein 1 [Brienomyrus brachyistius]